MFKVRNISNNEVWDVYGVEFHGPTECCLIRSDDIKTFFLIYKISKWEWVDAKDYSPLLFQS